MRRAQHAQRFLAFERGLLRDLPWPVAVVDIGGNGCRTTGRTGSPRRSWPGSGRDLRPATVDERGRVEQPGHERDRHSVAQHELLTDAARTMVVQEGLPPVADDLLRQVHGDHFGSVSLATLLDVFDQRHAEIAIRRLDDRQWNMDVLFDPLLLQLVGRLALSRLTLACRTLCFPSRML